MEPRENKATERDSEGVGWDMSIPQKLFIDWLLNGSLFSVTSAQIPFPLFFEVVFIDKTVTPLGPPLQAKF